MAERNLYRVDAEGLYNGAHLLVIASTENRAVKLALKRIGNDTRLKKKNAGEDDLQITILAKLPGARVAPQAWLITNGDY
jgi:hypothetical protein